MSTADERPLAIAVMGPTASGKTAFALDWAERIDSEIVSVDSALVYRGLDIGAARPDAESLQRTRHHVLDVREPNETYSAAEFATDALAAMLDISARGRVPVLAGGTGLYFHALLQGLSAMPEADADTREAIRLEASSRGWQAMHDELARVDPAAAQRIHCNDPQRITRALEVHRLTGTAISEWQRASRPGRFPFKVLKLVLCPADRGVLHERIATRFDAMLEDGFLGEVRKLRDRVGVHADLPAMRAVGYRQAWQHLDGDNDAVGFRELAIAATRQLAKRQLTWLRRELDARWGDPEPDRERLDDAIRLFLARP